MNKQIDNLLNELYHHQNGATWLIGLMDQTLSERDVSLAYKMEENKLAANNGAIGDMIISPIGIEIYKSGGWLVYAEKQKKLKLKEDRKIQANNFLKFLVGLATIASAIFAYVAVQISREQNIEINEIKADVKRLDSLLKFQKLYPLQSNLPVDNLPSKIRK